MLPKQRESVHDGLRGRASDVMPCCRQSAMEGSVRTHELFTIPKIRFQTFAAVAAFMGALLAVAHESDPKARDFKGAVVGPAWLADEQGSTLEKASSPFASSGVRLMAWFPANTFAAVNTSGNDVWGYVSASGREYALMGLSNGTGFVEVTNPGSSAIVKFITGPTSMWRNIKTYKTYAYAVSEGGGGIQVFDLSQIDNGVVTELPSVGAAAATPATHTMIINEKTGYLYRMGGGSSGLRIYNLNTNPAQPALVASWNPKYTHDGVVYNYETGPYAGKEIFFACGGLNGGSTDTGMDILDVTNKAAITVLGRYTYTNANYCHQVWLSEDRHYAYINDELDEDNRGIYAVGRIVDVSNLAAPVSAGTYNTGLNSIDHNEYVKGNKLFCSNYTTGLRVFDITSGNAPSQVAWFDTYPNDDASTGATFNGLWSNFPYLPSGTILGSDIERGLFVWRLGPEPVSISFPEGEPEMFDPRGQRVAVEVIPIAGMSVGAGGVVLQTTVDGVTTDTQMAQEDGNLWAAVSPSTVCGETVSWTIEVFVSDGTSVQVPPSGSNLAVSGSGTVIAVDDPCEISTGWVVGLTGDNATLGIWTQADPVGTSAQPENDHSSSGARCWVTGAGLVGGSLGAADVDGGTTTLTSPAYSLGGMTDPSVNYFRWYSNSMGADPNNDSMPIQISGNGGSSWVQLELVTENAGEWVSKSFRVNDFLASTNGTIKLRFIARDLGSGSVVEAAIDDLQVSETSCPVEGDLDGDGLVTTSDLAFVLLDFGPCPNCSSDLDASGTVDFGDVAYLLLLLG